MTQNGNKRLCALIKSKQHDHLGVAPLPEDNITYCDPIQKAIILNRQFTSVFTDDSKKSLPELGPSPYPGMEDITVSGKGVVKPMKNLKPHKPAGPDDDDQTAEQIVPVIRLLLQASLSQGSLLHGKEHLYHILRKAINQMNATIHQFFNSCSL